MNNLVTDHFLNRHIGLNDADTQKALNVVKANSLNDLIDETIPAEIQLDQALNIGEALTEAQYLKHIKGLANKNKVFKSYIGLGYYGTITPSVISRNIFENPGWYTQYTPYQSEIAQGRLEALLNFQTIVSDLTGLPIANASLLDEATAAAEAMLLLYNQHLKKNRKNPKNTFLLDEQVFPQTKAVVEAKATPLGIKIVYFNANENMLPNNEDLFGMLLQYPNKQGATLDYSNLVNEAQSQNMFTAVCADILSLTLLKPPGEWGADVVVGSTQRFGVPMGYGGPHAAYFATREKFLRAIPGRIIGISKDKNGKHALRMALQTREQHIRRDKATSNICTAQALLAIMASMYAVYHGAEGLKKIATKVNYLTALLKHQLASIDIKIVNNNFFDTITIDCTDDSKLVEKVRTLCLAAQLNFWFEKDAIQISLDECTEVADIAVIANIFAEAKATSYPKEIQHLINEIEFDAIGILPKLKRSSTFLTHPVFNSHRSETQMMRYIKLLENKDLSLTHSMIPLGSCTMKLNAATQLKPVSWAAFAHIHPFAPKNQVEGYQLIIEELEKDLSTLTGMEACSLQPNSGAQGEYTGLMVIRAYHLANEDVQRNIVLIPSSAHGTNPASATVAGMKVVVVACDEKGNIDFEDLKTKAEKHSNELAALMITYPSTHGVFENKVQEICALIHTNGGLVYMDGANMNAQVGLTHPGICGADVVHLNLHKTFAIPHGGGGPGVGPICVNEKLKPYLPSHSLVATGGKNGIAPVSAAPFGSASILLISYAYIKMLGSNGLKVATEIAILNANYIKAKLEKEYKVLFTGEKHDRVAHELIIDLRPFKELDIDAEDIAKRLIDYSFHAPTMSWPVAGTIMIEPTESEDLVEIDRFCDAMLQIKKELDAIALGEFDKVDNPIKNSPHTIEEVSSDNWEHAYSRQVAAYPLPSLLQKKFWPNVARVDNYFGDKNVVCTCPPIEAYAEVE